MDAHTYFQKSLRRLLTKALMQRKITATSIHSIMLDLQPGNHRIENLTTESILTIHSIVEQALRGPAADNNIRV
jgi:hypothetical protein